MERAMMAYMAGDEIDGAGPGTSLRYIGYSRSQSSELAVDINSGELYAVTRFKASQVACTPFHRRLGPCRPESLDRLGQGLLPGGSFSGVG